MNISKIYAKLVDEASNGRQQKVCDFRKFYVHVEYLTINKIFETVHVPVWNAVSTEVGWPPLVVVDRIYNHLTR